MGKNKVYSIHFQSQQRKQVQKEQLNKAIAAFILQRPRYQVSTFQALESPISSSNYYVISKWLCAFIYIRLIKCVSLYLLHSAMATRARATSHVENQVRESLQFYTIFRHVPILWKRIRSEKLLKGEAALAAKRVVAPMRAALGNININTRFYLEV